MKELQFTPVTGGACGAPPVRLPEIPGREAIFVMRADGDNLAAEPVENNGDLRIAASRDDRTLAFLQWSSTRRDSAWLLIPCASQTGLNGMTPPLPLARLEPGDLLASGRRFWIVTSLWTPEAIEVPAELRDKPCPVCGGELGLAQAVQCPCGRWMHLEKPTVPDDEEALNCFLAVGVCGGCQQPTSMAARVVPEIPEKLSVQRDDDAWDFASHEAAQSSGAVPLTQRELGDD